MNAIAARLPDGRLHLQQRVIRAEIDRDVRLGQPQVGDQRAKPVIGFNDPLVGVPSTAAGQVRGGADQKAVTWAYCTHAWHYCEWPQ